MNLDRKRGSVWGESGARLQVLMNSEYHRLTSSATLLRDTASLLQYKLAASALHVSYLQASEGEREGRRAAIFARNERGYREREGEREVMIKAASE